MRKDIVVLGLFLSLLVLYESYGKFTEALQERDRLIQVEREVNRLTHQLRVLKNLKIENKKVQLPEVSASELAEKVSFYGCSLHSSFAEKRDGNLKYVNANLDCSVPDFSTAKKLIYLLIKDYPVSVERFSYRTGRVSASLKIYGE